MVVNSFGGGASRKCAVPFVDEMNDGDTTRVDRKCEDTVGATQIG